ncbi:MAG: gliding motility lipoprotein GldH [Bacteroidia bacterium]|nr:gliding motility lipoprotein GldH [Bacteroidia bacterium]NNF83302.1 gliding motility lipoprotein GldH [Flavobacteriaceae bacterium]NNL79511.1 gliding motility lipoprotein GldH [Flavobacteriaceae bacterium]
MRSKIGLIIGVLGLLFSCDSDLVFDEYKSVDGAWDKDDSIEFKIMPPDTLNPYNLFINLRNTNDYKYNNLFLIVEMNYPNGKIKKDTLEYRMTTPEGEFLGAGFTDVKENKLWYSQAEIFDESGEYIVKINHAMRETGAVNGIEKLEGIIDVGFRIERPKNGN